MKWPMQAEYSLDETFPADHIKEFFDSAPWLG